MKIGLITSSSIDPIFIATLLANLPASDIEVEQGKVDGVDVLMVCDRPAKAYSVPVLQICDNPLRIRDVDFERITFLLLLRETGSHLVPADKVGKSVVMPSLDHQAGVEAWRTFLRRFGDRPTLVEKAGNFLQSAVKFIGSGLPQAPQEVVEDRLKICSTCEFRSPDGRCAKCGCPLATKTYWATESCPIGKWVAVLGANAEVAPRGGCRTCGAKNLMSEDELN